MLQRVATSPIDETADNTDEVADNTDEVIDEEVDKVVDNVAEKTTHKYSPQDNHLPRAKIEC